MSGSTLFSREHADRLRESLPPMNFAEATPAPESAQAYVDYYGLGFSDSRQTVRHSLGTLQTDGFQLVCQYFQVPASVQHGTVFVLHGYFDHVGLYGHLIGHCLGAGYSVVALDLPGHGLSSGIPASITSFRQYSEALVACLQLAVEQGVPRPWTLIGQSTGGAVILDALRDRQLAQRFPCESCILLAPLLRPAGWFRSRLLFLATRWFLPSIRRQFACNSHDPEFLQFLQFSDPLQSRLLQRDWVVAMIDYQRRFARSAEGPEPLHIIQGTGDGTVDWKYNLPRIQRKFPASRTTLIADAGHHLVNESPAYRDRVFSVIDDILVAQQH